MATSPTSIPFDPIQFLDAKRITGLVLVRGAEESPNANNPLDLDFNASADFSLASKGPPALQRKSSLNGNILWISNPSKAYFLQRKISNLAGGGSARVGFALQPAGSLYGKMGNDDDADGDAATFGSMGTEHDVIRSEGPYPFEMVAIKVQSRETVMGAENGESNVVASAKVELEALQFIAKHAGANANDCHVDFSHYTCLDRSTIYTIGPFYGEGSLFQYVVESRTLSEPIARHFFKHILMALKTLRDVGLCHRNVSLETVHLRASRCTLTDLGSCLRITSPNLPPHMVVGGNPRYIPPEVVRTEPSFDAYAADLWAAGIALCRMLFGTDAPFVWASPQDARYTEICVKGNLQGLASNQNSKFGMRPDGDRISAEGIDLIQSMLRANPVDRLSLEHTMQHSWLQGETAVPNFPTPVMKKREE